MKKSRTRKILMINTAFSRGGAAKIVQALHNGLNRTSEFSSYFAYGRGPKKKNERIFRFTFLSEVYFNAFLSRFMGLEGFVTWFSTECLRDYIKNNHFELVHLHNLHGYYLDLGFIDWLKKTKIPVVWTLHDEWPITGRCSYPVECDRWKTGCGKCPDLSLYPRSYFFDFSALMWKRKKMYFSGGWNPLIVCPSRWLADKVRESYLGRYRTEVIPNGINTELFKPKDKIETRRKFGLPLSKKLILFVAQKLKNKRKGAKYFFEGLKHIKTRNWMVLTLGRKLDLSLETNSNITQLGYISESSLISEIYSAVDIFCITSLGDTFPNAVLESLSCGIPVVGFKTGGIPEQVSPDCGILVEPRDVKGLAVAIDELLGNDEKRKAFSMRCRERILENYSIEKFKERYINLYKDLLR